MASSQSSLIQEFLRAMDLPEILGTQSPTIVKKWRKLFDSGSTGRNYDQLLWTQRFIFSPVSFGHIPMWWVLGGVRFSVLQTKRKAAISMKIFFSRPFIIQEKWRVGNRKIYWWKCPERRHYYLWETCLSISTENIWRRISEPPLKSPCKLCGDENWETKESKSES